MIVRSERPSSIVRPEPELQKRNWRRRSASLRGMANSFFCFSIRFLFFVYSFSFILFAFTERGHDLERGCERGANSVESAIRIGSTPPMPDAGGFPKMIRRPAGDLCVIARCRGTVGRSRQCRAGPAMPSANARSSPPLTPFRPLSKIRHCRAPMCYVWRGHRSPK